MTKDDLFERWINDFGPDFQFTGVYVEDRENFYKDLEFWYDSRRETELNAIKEELIKSLKELDDAVATAQAEEVEFREHALTFKGKGRIYDCYD